MKNLKQHWHSKEQCSLVQNYFKLHARKIAPNYIICNNNSGYLFVQKTSFPQNIRLNFLILRNEKRRFISDGTINTICKLQQITKSTCVTTHSLVTSQWGTELGTSLSIDLNIISTAFQRLFGCPYLDSNVAKLVSANLHWHISYFPPDSNANSFLKFATFGFELSYIPRVRWVFDGGTPTQGCAMDMRL